MIAPETPPPALDDDPGSEVAAPPSLPLCPYLVSASGDWRAPSPRKEHRCAAFLPPASLAPEKQARLCLTAGHVECATFLAARRAREARLGNGGVEPASAGSAPGRWRLARTAAVVEDAGGSRAMLAGVVADRRTWQFAPAFVLIVAVVALAISGLRGEGSAASIASPSPSPVGTPAPTSTVVPSTLGVIAETPASTLAPTQPAMSVAPTALPTDVPTAAPSARATYTVKSGDTLSGIAARYSTTVTALMTLNGLKDSHLKIGQVLLIP